MCSGGVVDVLGDIWDEATEFVEDAVDFIGDVGQDIIDGIVDVVEGVGDTFEAVIKDPLPTLVQIGGAMVGIPPYVTAAAITAAKGGDLEDIAKSAAISYASANALQVSGVGEALKDVGFDLTDSIAQGFDLPLSTAGAIADSITSAAGTGIVGGLNAVLTGKDVSEGITSGFTSGLIYSGTNSFFNEVNKNPSWGLSPKALDVLKGASTTALNTIVSGKGDPTQAVANYVAYSTLKLGASEVYKNARKTFEEFTGKTELAEKAQDAYLTVKAQFDSEANKYNQKLDEAKRLQNEYTQLYDSTYKPAFDALNNYASQFDLEKGIYDQQLSIYENAKYLYDNYDQLASYNDARYLRSDGGLKTKEDLANEGNAAAKAAEQAAQKANTAAGYYSELAGSVQETTNILKSKEEVLKTLGADLTKFAENLQTPKDGNLAEQLKKASDNYQKNYEFYASSKEAAERAAENYNKLVAEVSVRDATIDALNTGVISVTGKTEDGGYELSNGMVLKDGKFFQDDEQLFTNAAGILQNGLDFKDDGGNDVRYGPELGRQLSTSDVKNIFQRDYGIPLTDDDAKQFVGLSYTSFDNTKFQDYALDRITDEFKSIAEVAPPEELVNEFKSSANPLEAAKASATLYKGADDRSVGLFDSRDVSFVKTKLNESIKLSNTTGQVSSLNPADLSEKEMSAFVDNYVKATPEQRAALLRGRDSKTYNVINDMLQDYAGASEKTTGQVYQQPVGFGSIKESDLTNYSQIAKTGLRGSAADIVGLGVRAGQSVGELFGYDTPTLDKMQDLLTKDKETQMNKLVGNEKAVAGGLSSGITSAVSWTLGGPITSIATLGGIAANNAWTEGANAVIDERGNTWSNADEAKKNGVFTFRQLTPQENGLRTAIMTSIEIAGEAIGVPGMSKIMKGMPLTGDVNVLVDSVKRLAAGLGNEQAAELLTTTAQMAADKYTSVGLGQNATFEDFKNALVDTAIATTVAVGTAGSVGTATQNLRDASKLPNIFSSDLREEVQPTLPSLQELYKLSGITDTELNDLSANITNKIQTGGVGLTDLKNSTIAKLQDYGITTARANTMADEMINRVLDSTITSSLSPLNLDSAQFELVKDKTKESLKNEVGLQTYLQDVAGAMLAAGSDPAQTQQALSQLPGIGTFVDTALVTEQELQNIAQGQGYQLTPQEIQKYSGLKNQEQVTQEFIQQIDPLAVTEQEVRDAYAQLGLTKPATQDIQKLVGQYAETDLAGRAQANLEAARYNSLVQQLDQLAQGASPEVMRTIDLVKQDLARQIESVGGDVSQIAQTIETQYGSLTESQKQLANQLMQQGSTLTDAIESARTSLTGQIAGLSEDVQAKYNALTAAQKAEVDNRIAMGESLQNAIQTTAAGLGTQIGQLEQTVQNQYSQLTSAQKAEVDARVAQGESLQNAIQTAAAGLGTQIGQLEQTVQNQYNQLNAAQKAEVDARVAQGESLQNAIQTATSSLGGQIGQLEQTVQNQYTQLNAAQKAEVDARIAMGESLTSAIQNVASQVSQEIGGVRADVQAKYAALTAEQKALADQLARQGVDLNAAIEQARAGITAEVQTKYNALTDQQKALADQLAKQGVDLNAAIEQARTATQQQISGVQQDVQAKFDALTDIQKQFATQLTQQGVDTNTAIEAAKSSLGTQITGVGAQVTELARQQEAARLAAEEAARQQAIRDRVAADRSARAQQQAQAQALAAEQLKAIMGAQQPIPADEAAKFKQPFITSQAKQEQFKGPLQEFMQEVQRGDYTQDQFAAPQSQTSPQMQQNIEQGGAMPNYFTYGQQTDIDQLFSPSSGFATAFPGFEPFMAKRGGLATPLMAGGGIAGYAGGGLPMVPHSGKMRVDFRSGAAVSGPGDGQSDDIPAMLADGEFVFPADVVAALGNGSTKAGSEKLYDMMHSIRSHHRSAKPQDLPPPAKASPLDYLSSKKSAKAARR